MELLQLRYYVAVARLNSFSLASRQLNVAQSALSRQVRLLEEELGVQLLDRNGRGAIPTNSGIAFLEGATALISQAEELQRMVLSHSTIGGKVQMGIPVACDSAIARWIIKICQAGAPSVSLRLHEGLSGDLLQLLGTGLPPGSRDPSQRVRLGVVFRLKLSI